MLEEKHPREIKKCSFQDKAKHVQYFLDRLILFPLDLDDYIKKSEDLLDWNEKYRW